MKVLNSRLTGEPLHLIVIPQEDVPNVPGRWQATVEEDLLQLAVITDKAGKEWPAHYHLPTRKHASGTQECWVVISGKVEVTYYDLDHTVLHTEIIPPHGVTLTLNGGHKYKLLEDSVVYEFKSGPYFGPELDKKLL
jgi:hypothetical protein